MGHSGVKLPDEQSVGTLNQAGNMPLKIMVLTESFYMYRDAVRYSIALAKRLDPVS